MEWGEARKQLFPSVQLPSVRYTVGTPVFTQYSLLNHVPHVFIQHKKNAEACATLLVDIMAYSFYVSAHSLTDTFLRRNVIPYLDTLLQWCGELEGVIAKATQDKANGKLLGARQELALLKSGLLFSLLIC